MSTEVALNYNMDLPDLGLTKDGKTKSEGIGILVDMAKPAKLILGTLILLMLQTNILLT